MEASTGGWEICYSGSELQPLRPTNLLGSTACDNATRFTRGALINTQEHDSKIGHVDCFAGSVAMHKADVRKRQTPYSTWKSP